MGKGGRGKLPKSAAAAPDDDALLAAAIEQASAERAEAATQAKEKPKKPEAKPKPAATPANSGSCLTMPEVLAKLDRVMTFTIARQLPDGSKDACPSADGAVTFYLDAADAQAALEALKAEQPDARLSLDYTALGRAFALTQGLMGLRAAGPARLQFCRSTVEDVGERGVPSELQERMRGAGPFPLFYSEKLGSQQFTPVFFAVSDLHELWVTCGGDPRKLPEATVTDLGWAELG